MGERKRATNYEVLLVAINSRYTHSNPAVYSLKAYAEQAGHSVAVAEYNINQPVLEILKDIIGKNCQWIGFSCYIWNITINQTIKVDFSKFKHILGWSRTFWNWSRLVAKSAGD